MRRSDAGAVGRGPAATLAFFLSEAERLAGESVGDRQAFLLVHSGATVRKRANWHLHVFVVQHRWQKGWLHTVLGVKSLVMAVAAPFVRLKARFDRPTTVRTET